MCYFLMQSNENLLTTTFFRLFQSNPCIFICISALSFKHKKISLQIQMRTKCFPLLSDTLWQESLKGGRLLSIWGPHPHELPLLPFLQPLHFASIFENQEGKEVSSQFLLLVHADLGTGTTENGKPASCSRTTTSIITQPHIENLRKVSFCSHLKLLSCHFHPQEISLWEDSPFLVSRCMVFYLTWELYHYGVQLQYFLFFFSFLSWVSCMWVVSTWLLTSIFLFEC